MQYRQVAPDYAVMGQVTADQMREIAAAGFRSVICNRPDGEDPGQPTAAEIERAATEAGLAFRHIPAVSGQLTHQNVIDQAKALEELEGPVFAYCRSGARSTNLYLMAQQLKG